jgi:DNA-binding response OmpR family regulator
MSTQAGVTARCILVADDELAITSLIAAMLTHTGYQVVQAHGGVEAISLARQERPDLILLDVMMPDLDGRDTIRVLKLDPALRDVPVILFSSADEADVHWREAGADGFLQKPFSIRALPEFVRSYLPPKSR